MDKQDRSDMQIIKEIAKEVNNKKGRMYFVGGYVRDQLMEKEIKDIDVEVFGISSDELLAILSKYGVVDQIGKSFGIYKVFGLDIDFSMPRIEKNIGKRHTDFEVSVDPYMSTLDACRRRDFTMNALLQDVLTNEIIDHFGGILDIQNKVIKHVDNNTFIQDELRVLRACQFAARFNFKISEETLKLCKKIDCTNLPKERIYTELEKVLLKSDRPSIFFEYARQINLLSSIFSPMNKLIGVKQEAKWHPEGDVWTHTMMVLDEAAKLRDKSNYPIAYMLAAICHDLGKITTTRRLHGKIISYNHENEIGLTKEFLKNITDNKDLIKSVYILVRNHMRPNILAKNNSSDKAVRKLIVATSGKLINIYDEILLAKADRMGRDVGDKQLYNIDEWWKNKLEKVNNNKISIEPLVTGRDLIDIGYTQSKQLGDTLKYAFELQIKGFSKEEIIQKVRKEVN